MNLRQNRWAMTSPWSMLSHDWVTTVVVRARIVSQDVDGEERGAARGDEDASQCARFPVGVDDRPDTQ